MKYALFTPSCFTTFFVGSKHLLLFAMGCGAETAFSLLAAAAVASQIWLGIVCLFKTRKLWCQTVNESNSHLHHIGGRLLENRLSETGLHPHSLLQKFYNDNNKQCCLLDFWSDYHYFTLLSFAAVTINKVKEKHRYSQQVVKPFKAAWSTTFLLSHIHY